MGLRQQGRSVPRKRYYTPRLKYLAELPAGKVAGHFDKVDRKKFLEVLGDKMCSWGNVPMSTTCTGTPQQVKDDVKELCGLFGNTSTLILDRTIPSSRGVQS